jgi:hypothetical protein
VIGLERVKVARGIARFLEMHRSFAAKAAAQDDKIKVPTLSQRARQGWGTRGGNFYLDVGAIMKKKAKRVTKTKEKKTVKKQCVVRKPKDTEKVRQEIAGMVKAGAKQITKAVMGHATNGELAQAKYLFEMAGIFPKPTEGDEATPEEDCLAKTLLDRINQEAEKNEKIEDTSSVKVDETATVAGS